MLQSTVFAKTSLLSRLRGVALASVSLLALAACDTTLNADTQAAAQSGTQAAAQVGVEQGELMLAGDTIELHFTEPGVAKGEQVDTELDEMLVALFDGASFSIDLALYEFDHPDVVAAVLRAFDRGVSVRFVGYGSNSDDAGYIALAAAGVPTTLRQASALMHNKFAVVDGARVASGSANFTHQGLSLNNNYMLVFDSLHMADAFSQEFDQMFDGTFGPKKSVVAGRAPVSLNGAGSAEILFSPKDDTVVAMRDALASADHSVHFMVFSFTRSDISDDMIALSQAGVEVVGVFDQLGASNYYAKDDALAAAGIPVYIDGNKNNEGSKGAKLHHKVMIIDADTDSEPMVVTGSFNWSNNAVKTNDENLVILRGAELVTPFMDEFCRVFAIGTIHEDYVGPIPTPCLDRPAPSDTTFLPGGRDGNTTAMVDSADVRISSLLANPNGSDRYAEYVAISNLGTVAADLSGWTLGDVAKSERHVFAEGSALAAGETVVIYSGDVDQTGRLVASSGALSLNNSSESISLGDASGAIIDDVTYSSQGSGEVLIIVEVPEIIEAPKVAILTIGSLLANPVGSDAIGEYIIIRNDGNADADISGYALADALKTRHIFSEGTMVPAGDMVMVYSGGAVVGTDQLASTGALSLNNSGDTVTFTDLEGAVVDSLTYSAISEGEVVSR